MRNKTTLKKKAANSIDFTDVIIDSIQDIKGKNILKLDLRDLEDGPADYFIICEGDSVTQISSISDNVVKRMKEEFDILPSHVEGKQFSTWVLVDYFDIIVHIFYPETRRFYELEDLWSDAKITEYQNI